MTSMLTGRSLLWTSYDPPRLLTALIQSLLTQKLRNLQVQSQLSIVEDLADYEVMHAGETLGLAFWNLCETDQLTEICRSIRRLKSQLDCPLNIVFCPRAMGDHVSVLCESGAQIVVTQVPSLQRAIEDCILPLIESHSAHLPLSQSGHHPLVSGLADRLPWPELD